MIVPFEYPVQVLRRDPGSLYIGVGYVTSASVRFGRFIVVRAESRPSDAGQSEIRSIDDGLDVRFFPSGQRVGEPVIHMKNPRRFLSVTAMVGDITRLRVIFKGEMTIGTYE